MNVWRNCSSTLIRLFRPARNPRINWSTILSQTVREITIYYLLIKSKRQAMIIICLYGNVWNRFFDTPVFMMVYTFHRLQVVYPPHTIPFQYTDCYYFNNNLRYTYTLDSHFFRKFFFFIICFSSYYKTGTRSLWYILF